MAQRDVEIDELVKSKAVMPYEEQAQVVPQSTVFTTSTDDISEEDLMYPIVFLTQSQTPFVKDGKVEVGQYYMSGEVPQESITFVPMTQGKDRLRVNPKGEKVCRSFDLVHGIGNPGILCADCTFAKANWKEGIKPQCNVRYHFIGFIPEFNTPARIIMKSSAINTAKQLNARIKFKGIGKFAVKLGTTKRFNNGNEYFVPTLEAAQGINEEELLSYVQSIIPEGEIKVADTEEEEE